MFPTPASCSCAPREEGLVAQAAGFATTPVRLTQTVFPIPSFEPDSTPCCGGHSGSRTVKNSVSQINKRVSSSLLWTFLATMTRITLPGLPMVIQFSYSIKKKLVHSQAFAQEKQAHVSTGALNVGCTLSFKADLLKADKIPKTTPTKVTNIHHQANK